LHLKKRHRRNARRSEKLRERKAAVSANLSLEDDMENAGGFSMLLSSALYIKRSMKMNEAMKKYRNILIQKRYSDNTIKTYNV
jgi:hypothetical protein